MDFGSALTLIKQGKKVCRSGWNGKDMFVFLVPGSEFKVNRPPLLGIYPEVTLIKYHSHIDMKTANGQIVPWLCSQTDMLAEDWEEFSEKVSHQESISSYYQADGVNIKELDKFLQVLRQDVIMSFAGLMQNRYQEDNNPTWHKINIEKIVSIDTISGRVITSKALLITMIHQELIKKGSVISIIKDTFCIKVENLIKDQISDTARAQIVVEYQTI